MLSCKQDEQIGKVLKIINLVTIFLSPTLFQRTRVSFVNNDNIILYVNQLRLLYRILF